MYYVVMVRALRQRRRILDVVVYYANLFLILDRWFYNCIEAEPERDKIINKSYDATGSYF